MLLTVSAIGQAVPGAATSSQTAGRKSADGSDRLWVYVGTYTSPSTGSKGIYLLELDRRSGELKPVGLAAEVANPSFLAMHPNQRFLYAVGELQEFQAKKAGAVSALAIHAETGKLTLLNQQPSGGQGPCHVTVAPGGRYVLTANYTSGTVAVLPIHKDGRLGQPTATVQHKGSGPNVRRQEGPHAHSINPDPAGRFAFAPDLGADKVFAYRLGANDGSLVANDPPAAPITPGSGPRHFAFHPHGRFAYVINELASTITAVSYDAERGILKESQTISTLPEGFSDQSFTADIHVHPAGKFLYGSNRGHDSIAIFAIDEQTGRLTAIGRESTRGKTPRNFAIDSSGTWLLAANQGSNTIIVFRIDLKTGLLTAAGNAVDIPSPVCVQFAAKTP